MIPTKSLLLTAFLATGFTVGARANTVDVTNLNLTAYSVGQELLGTTAISLNGGGTLDIQSSSGGFIVERQKTQQGYVNVLANRPTSSGLVTDIFTFVPDGREGLLDLNIGLLGPTPDAYGSAVLSATSPLTAAQLSIASSDGFGIGSVEVKTQQYNAVSTPGTLALIGLGLPLFGRRKTNTASTVMTPKVA